jgi:hypothetical protein
MLYTYAKEFFEEDGIRHPNDLSIYKKFFEFEIHLKLQGKDKLENCFASRLLDRKPIFENNSQKTEVRPKPEVKKEEAPKGIDLYPEIIEKKYHGVDKMTSIGVLNKENEICDKIIEYKKKIGADYDDWEIKKDSVKDKIDTVTSFIQDGIWDLDKYKKNIMEQYKWEVKLLQFVEKDPSLNEQQKKSIKR